MPSELTLCRGEAAVGEDGIGLFRPEADDDEGGWPRRWISARVFGVGGADGLWEAVSGAEYLDGSILAVVAGGDAEMSPAGRGEGNCECRLRWATIRFHPNSSRRSPLRFRAKSRRGPLDCQRDDEGDDVGADGGESCEVKNLCGAFGPAGEERDPARAPGVAPMAMEHGIRGGHVVSTAFAEEEEGEGHEIHEGDHAIAVAAKVGCEAGDPEWGSKEIGADRGTGL